jgi:hypothetical protein
MFPAYRINLWISSSIVLRKGIFLGIITSVLNIISLASTVFINSSLTNRACFYSIFSTRALVKAYRSIRGGLWKLPVD